MDGWKNAITEKEPKTDKKVTNKNSEVKLKKPLRKEKDVTSVPATSVLQKDRTVGTQSPPQTGFVGVSKDASASPDIRSRPGGRSVEVRGPNATGSGGQLHPGKSISTAPKNCQPNPVTESAAAVKPASRSSTADIKDSSVLPKPRSPSPENKDLRKPARPFSTPDIHERPVVPTPAPRSPAAESKDVPPKPAGRTSTADPKETLSAALSPSPRTPAAKDVPPKPARRSPIAKRDAQSENTTQLSPTADNPDPRYPPKPAPRSSASLRISPSTPDNAVPIESRSNHQFIADENVSVWSSSIQIDRPLSTESICRICHESDQVEPLISPCLCRGTLSVVHRTCLQHWLAESDSSSCELCRFMYITKRVPKYSVLGSVVAWIRQNRRQRKALLVDTLGMIAFVPFATMITYVAAALADGIEYQESPSWTDVTIRFAIVTFISLMTTIDVAYATYWMLRAQHHFSSWYSWYRRNSDVTLLPHPQQ